MWEQDDELTGGKCKVNWRVVTSPMDRAGLGTILALVRKSAEVVMALAVLEAPKSALGVVGDAMRQ